MMITLIVIITVIVILLLCCILFSVCAGIVKLYEPAAVARAQRYRVDVARVALKFTISLRDEATPPTDVQRVGRRVMICAQRIRAAAAAVITCAYNTGYIGT